MKKIATWFSNEFYLIIAFMTFTVYVSNDSFLPAMEPIATSFHTTIAVVNMSMAVSILGFCILQIPIGILSDKIGRRPLVIAGGLIFSGATFAITNVPNIELFMACRLLQGIGCSAIAGTAGAMINEHYPYKKRIFAISMVSQLSILAPMMGPLLGTYILIITNNQWEYIYIVNNVIFITFLIMAIFFLPETLKSKLEKKRKFKAEDVNIVDEIYEHYDKADEEKEPEKKETIMDILRVKSYLYLCLGTASRVFVTVAWIAGSAKIIMIDMGYSKEIYSYYQIPVFISLLLGNLLVGKIGHVFTPSEYIRNHLSISVPVLIILFTVCFSDFNLYSVTVLMSGLLFASGSLLPIHDSVLLSPFKSKGLASSVTGVIISGVNVVSSILPPLLFQYDSMLLMSIIAIVTFVSIICSATAVPHVQQIERHLD